MAGKVGGVVWGVTAIAGAEWIGHMEGGRQRSEFGAVGFSR